MPARTGLPGGASSFHVDKNIKSGQRIGNIEGLSNDIVKTLVAEIVGHFPIIYGDLSFAASKIYSGYGGFSSPGSKCQIFCHYSFDSLQFDPLGLLSGVRMTLAGVHLEIGK